MGKFIKMKKKLIMYQSLTILCHYYFYHRKTSSLKTINRMHLYLQVQGKMVLKTYGQMSNELGKKNTVIFFSCQIILMAGLQVLLGDGIRVQILIGSNFIFAVIFKISRNSKKFGRFRSFPNALQSIERQEIER